MEYVKVDFDSHSYAKHGLQLQKAVDLRCKDKL